eukprot:5216524-Pyramimonas_sp.AAC.1
MRVGLHARAPPGPLLVKPPGPIAVAVAVAVAIIVDIAAIVAFELARHLEREPVAREANGYIPGAGASRARPTGNIPKAGASRA